VDWLLNHNGRRALAFFALLGCCGIMTTFAAVAMYLVRSHPQYVFYLGMAAHVQILLATTGFMALFVKRTISVSRDGVSITDNANVDVTVHQGDPGNAPTP
jgi:hypothetical protein